MRYALTMVLLALVGGCALHVPPAVDLNAASPEAIAAVAGIPTDEAVRIAANRPYYSKQDLLARRIVSRDTYDAIAPALFVGPPGMPDYLAWVIPVP